ncbi:fimbrial biogenesis chaperone [Enterobacter hormaechei]
MGNKKLDDVTYVMPSGTARFPLPNGTSGNTLTFKVINDYGSPVYYTWPVCDPYALIRCSS